MDYELRRDIYGRYQAIFSMGHEALGLWLSEELNTNLPLIAQLQQQIEQLRQGEAWEYQHNGREFILTLRQDGVEVRAALLDDDNE